MNSTILYENIVIPPGRFQVHKPPRLSVLKDDGYNYLLGVFLEGHQSWYILLSLSFACNCSSCMWTNKGKRLNLKPGSLCLERRLADYHIDSCFRITFESSWEL